MMKRSRVATMLQRSAPLADTMPASKPLYIFPSKKMWPRLSHCVPAWLGMTMTSSAKPNV